MILVDQMVSAAKPTQTPQEQSGAKRGISVLEKHLQGRSARCQLRSTGSPHTGIDLMYWAEMEGWIDRVLDRLFAPPPWPSK